MAVYAPDDTALNPSSSSAAADPNLLQRLLNYINPVAPAQANSLTQAPNPAASPTPVPPQLAAGGPPVPPSLSGSPTVNYPIGGGPGNAMQAPTGIVPGGGSSGGGGASGSYTSQAPYGQQLPPTNAPLSYGPQQSPTPWFTGSNTPYAPNPIVGAPVPPTKPTGPGFRGSGSGAAGSPSMRRGPASVASGSPFTTVNRPNMGPAPMYDQRGNPVGPVAGGALARGGGAPLMSALDLSSLFGRR
jgi:hypothetical protein